MRSCWPFSCGAPGWIRWGTIPSWIHQTLSAESPQIAREANARLEVRDVRPFLDEDRIVATGQAIENPAPDHALYQAWATSVVRDELQKAGWRLADLL